MCALSQPCWFGVNPLKVCGREIWGYTENLLLGTRALPPALLRGVPWNIFEINVSRRGCSITFCLNSLQWVMGKVFLFRKLGFLFWMPLIKTNDVSLVVRLSQQLRKSNPRYKAGEGCNPRGLVASSREGPGLCQLRHCQPGLWGCTCHPKKMDYRCGQRSELCWSPWSLQWGSAHFQMPMGPLHYQMEGTGSPLPAECCQIQQAGPGSRVCQS